jgi:membrane-associated phospholipid phosphatase
MLTEFVQHWVAVRDDPQGNGGGLTALLAGADVDAEIAELRQIKEYRPGAMSETVSQRGGIAKYWYAILGFNRGSHPCTYYVTQGMLKIAQFVAMYHKNHYQRPRPSQLDASLLPEIAVPGHASYPSAHATESYFLSRCLLAVIDGEFAGAPPQAVIPNLADAHSALARLAQRISRNREVLGLHYPSDSEAGRILANHTFGILDNCPNIKRLFQAATQEWQQFV